MEDQCSPLNWPYYYQEEGIEELKHALLYTNLELETTILSAHEEIARKEGELVHLQDLLTTTFRERYEAQAKWQRLTLEKLILLQQLEINVAPKLGITTTSNEDEKKGGELNTRFSYSDTDDNLISSPCKDPIPPPTPPPLAPPPPIERLEPKKPLPEKGKLLRAVMEAGPLLQTLLLAGPLPQWQHPPPKLNSIEIPPITISSISANTCLGKKRDMVHREASDSSPNTKYQKVFHQSP